jgi:hypothetical protein
MAPLQRPRSAGPRHRFVCGSRTRPFPQPPNGCSRLTAGSAEGALGVAGVEGALAPTVVGGFRTGAPAANKLAGTANVANIVVTATKSCRHIERPSHGSNSSTIVGMSGAFNGGDAEPKTLPVRPGHPSVRQSSPPGAGSHEIYIRSSFCYRHGLPLRGPA